MCSCQLLYFVFQVVCGMARLKVRVSLHSNLIKCLKLVLALTLT